MVVQGHQARRASEKDRRVRRAGVAGKQLQTSGDDRSALNDSHAAVGHGCLTILRNERKGKHHCSESAKHKTKPWDVRRSVAAVSCNHRPSSISDLGRSPIDPCRGDEVPRSQHHVPAPPPPRPSLPSSSFVSRLAAVTGPWMQKVLAGTAGRRLCASLSSRACPHPGRKYIQVRSVRSGRTGRTRTRRSPEPRQRDGQRVIAFWTTSWGTRGQGLFSRGRFGLREYPYSRRGLVMTNVSGEECL